jgi:ketosteroid isomerase-like protein
MSQSNEDVINGLYQAFAQGDIPAILGLIADDVEWRAPENLPHGGDFHGRDGVMRFFQGLGETWDGLELDLQALVSRGDRVLAVTSVHGRLRATSEQTGYRSVHAWTVRDGVPVRFDEYVDAPLTLPTARPAHAV